jgi:hypothetical protein
MSLFFFTIFSVFAFFPSQVRADDFVDAAIAQMVQMMTCH